MDGFIDYLNANHPDLPARIEETEQLSDEDEALIKEYLVSYKANISRISEEIKTVQDKVNA